MRKKIIICVVALLLLGCLVPVGLIIYTKFRYNPTASCANCRRQLSLAMTVNAHDHEGWFPSGETKPLESIVKALSEYWGPEREYMTVRFISNQLPQILCCRPLTRLEFPAQLHHLFQHFWCCIWNRVGAVVHHIRGNHHSIQVRIRLPASDDFN